MALIFGWSISEIKFNKEKSLTWLQKGGPPWTQSHLQSGDPWTSRWKAEENHFQKKSQDKKSSISSHFYKEESSLSTQRSGVCDVWCRGLFSWWGVVFLCLPRLLHLVVFHVPKCLFSLRERLHTCIRPRLAVCQLVMGYRWLNQLTIKTKMLVVFFK